MTIMEVKMNSKIKNPLILAVISLILVLISMVYLVNIGSSLEKNNIARSLIIDIFNNDPKVMRDTASGTISTTAEQFATDTLIFFKQFYLIPVGFLFLAVILNISGLIIMNRNRRASGILLCCSAVASSFTIIPPILQMISGLLILKSKTAVVDT